MSDASKQTDPFNVASLRIEPSSGANGGVKRILTQVSVRKPHRQEFFRAHPAPEYRAPMATLEFKEEKETYLVAPDLASELDAEIRRVEMRVCISRSGSVFLWPVPLPADDGRSNSWNESARTAVEIAESKWVRMSSNMGAGAYDAAVAPEGVAEPRWPEESFSDLLKLGFGKGKLISSFDHPMLKRLRGE